MSYLKGKYVKAHIRDEGTINQEWTLIDNQGNEHRFYAIEGSPQDSLSDELVEDVDPQLSEALTTLAYEPFCDEDEVTEWDVDLISSKVSNINKEPI